MRFGVMIAAAAGVLCAGQANAATIVQTSADMAGYFQRFDASKGTLTNVTMALTASNTRFFTIFASDASPIPFSYTTNGTIIVNTLAGPVSVNVSGSGASTVLMSGSSVFTGNAQTSASGSLTTSLDALAFVGTGLFVIEGYDPFYNDAGVPSDTAYSAPGAVSIFQAHPISRLATRVGATLTYTYTPTVAAVPEPATWAMMLAGFSLAGIAMRRRRVTTAHA